MLKLNGKVKSNIESPSNIYLQSQSNLPDLIPIENTFNMSLNILS